METFRGESISELKQESPVFIWAVSARCGTGLLQRLVTSSREVFVYGENHYLTRQIPIALQDAAQFHAGMEQSTQQLASGDYSHWFPDVFPDHEEYKETLTRNYYNVISTYRKTAKDLDFERWGTKLPRLPIKHIRTTQRFLPNSKHICIYRNIYDVAKSLKARQFVEDLPSLKRECQRWLNNMKNLFEVLIDDESILTVPFEELIEHKSKWAQRICNHLDIESVELDVFDKKVNTFRGSTEKGYSPSEYIEPEALTKEEKDLLRQIPEEIMKKGGYEYRD